MLKKYKKITICFLLMIIIWAISLVNKTFQNDTFYTIKVGQSILKNGVDMLDHFSIHTNLPYVYPHWLYDVSVYIIYSFSGYLGLYISSIIIFIVLIVLIYFIINFITENKFISVFLVFVFANTIAIFIGVRAQTVSYLLFALELFFIELFLKKGKNKYLFFLVIISLILCNVHSAVWLFYFVVFLPYIVDWFISTFLSKKINFTLKDRIIFGEYKNIKKIFITIFIALLMGFIVPNGLNSFTHLFKLFLGNSQSYISEHQKTPFIMSIFPLLMYIQVLFFAYKSRIKLSDFFMLSGLLLMSILSSRHVSLFCLLGIIYYARCFSFFLSNTKFNIKRFIPKHPNRLIFVALILCIALTTLRLYNSSKLEYIDKKEYPIEATKYIKNNINIKEMRLFNDYNFGSYLLLNDIPVFIDSRCDLYTKQFSGLDYDIFDDYMNISSDYEEKFEFYKITHILISNDDDLFKKLNNNKSYTVLYKDKKYTLFSRVGENL